MANIASRPLYLLPVFLFLLSFAVNSCSAQETFSDAGCFSVEFPGKNVVPQELVMPMVTVAGSIDMNMLFVAEPEGMAAVSYADFPTALVKTIEPTSMLATMRKGAVANADGELLYEKDDVMQGFLANDFAVKRADDSYLRVLMFLVGNRVYQIMYGGTSEANLRSERAESFISSFRIDLHCRAEQGGDTVPVSTSPLVIQPFTSNVGCFSALLPQREGEDLALLSSEQTTGFGMQSLDMYVVREGGREYVISFVDYPSAMVEFVDSKALMKEVQVEGLKKIEGLLVGERNLTVQGFPAMEYHARGKLAKVDLFVRVRLIWSGERLYQIMYGDLREGVLLSESVEEYFDAFHIDLSCRADQGADTIPKRVVYHPNDFVSEAGCFSIVYPEHGSRPLHTTQQVPIDEGNLEMEIFANYDESGAFMVGYLVIPSLRSVTENRRFLLEESKNGVVSGSDGNLQWERDTVVQGFVAKEYQAEFPKGHVQTYQRALILIAGDRMYDVRVVSRTEEGLQTEIANAFFESFQIDAGCIRQ